MIAEVLLLAFLAACVAGIWFLCPPGRPEDEGPWRLDERTRGHRCPYRSAFSARLCHRHPGHRGHHDAPARPAIKLLAGE